MPYNHALRVSFTRCDVPEQLFAYPLTLCTITVIPVYRYDGKMKDDRDEVSAPLELPWPDPTTKGSRCLTS
jgi:hypothetical protein